MAWRGARAEIAVRIALGAHPSRVVAMIVRETAGVVIIGVAIGAGLAFVASRLIASTLFGIAPRDPATFAAATAVLLAVAACAGYLPARRASKLEPIAASARGVAGFWSLDCVSHRGGDPGLSSKTDLVGPSARALAAATSRFRRRAKRRDCQDTR